MKKYLPLLLLLGGAYYAYGRKPKMKGSVIVPDSQAITEKQYYANTPLNSAFKKIAQQAGSLLLSKKKVATVKARPQKKVSTIRPRVGPTFSIPKPFIK